MIDVSKVISLSGESAENVAVQMCICDRCVKRWLLGISNTREKLLIFGHTSSILGAFSPNFQSFTAS